MIDYYKVYQSIDDNILKNVSEVIKLNGNLEQIYNLLFIACGLGGLCFLLILVRFVDFFYDFGSKETSKKSVIFWYFSNNFINFIFGFWCFIFYRRK